MAENQIGIEISAAISRASVTAIRDSVTQAFNRVPISVAVDTASLDRVQKQLSSVAKIPLTLDRAKIIAEAKSIYSEIRQIFGQPIKIGATSAFSPAGSSQGALPGSINLSQGFTNAIAAAGGSPDQILRARKEETEALKAATKATRLQQEENRRLAASQATVTDQLTRTTHKFSHYVSVASLFFNTFRGISIAVRDVQFFNTEVNKLGQVFEGNSLRAKEVSSRVLSIARAYGQSGKEILKMTSLLAQSGNKFQGQGLLDAVNAISQTPLTASFGTMEETAKGVIAALNQFNLSGSETIRILDIANKLSKEYAFQSADLFTAVERGGASFSAVGGTIEEFGALIATLRQVTGLSAETIGTGINTIAIRGLRQEVVDFTSQLTGGAIFKANGELKTFTERLLAVADVFDTLNEIQRGDVIEKLAGIRQGKLLIPLLKNPQLARETIASAQKAEGETARDAARGLDTIESQVQRIGTSFQQIFLDLSQDNSIKNLISDFAILTTTVTDLVKATGLLGPLASSISRVFGAFALITTAKIVKNSFVALAENVNKSGTAAGIAKTVGNTFGTNAGIIPASSALQGLSSDGKAVKTKVLSTKDFVQLQTQRFDKIERLKELQAEASVGGSRIRESLAAVRLSEKGLLNIGSIGIPNNNVLNLASSARILALAKSEPEIREKFINRRGSFLASNLGRVDQDTLRSELISGSSLGTGQRNRIIANAARSFIESMSQEQVLTPPQIDRKAREFVKKNGIDKIPFQFLTAAVESANISSNARLGFISKVVNRQASEEFSKTTPFLSKGLLEQARQAAFIDEANRLFKSTPLPSNKDEIFRKVDVLLGGTPSNDPAFEAKRRATIENNIIPAALSGRGTMFGAKLDKEIREIVKQSNKDNIEKFKVDTIARAKSSITDEVAINRLFSERSGNFGAFKTSIENRILKLNEEEIKVQEQIVANKQRKNAQAVLDLETTKNNIRANREVLETTLQEVRDIRKKIRARRNDVVSQATGLRSTVFGALVGARTGQQLADIAVGDAPRNVGGIRGAVQRFRGVSNTLPSFIDQDPSIAADRRANIARSAMFGAALILPAITDQLFKTKDTLTQDFKLREDTIDTVRSNANKETARGAITGGSQGLFTASLIGLRAVPQLAIVATLIGGFSSLAARVAETTRSLATLNAALAGASKEERKKILQENLGVFRAEDGKIPEFLEKSSLALSNPGAFLKDIGNSFIQGRGPIIQNLAQADVDSFIERLKNDKNPSLASLSNIRTSLNKNIQEGISPKEALERAIEDERSFLTNEVFNSDQLTLKQIDSLTEAVLGGIKPQLEELAKVSEKAEDAVKNFNNTFGKTFDVLFEALSGQIENQISKTKLAIASLGVNKSFLGDLQGTGSGLDISGISSTVIPLIVKQIKDAVAVGSINGKRFDEDGVRGVLTRAGISKEAQDPTIGLLLLDRAISDISDVLSKADNKFLEGVDPQQAGPIAEDVVDSTGLKAILDETANGLKEAFGFLNINAEQAGVLQSAVNDFKSAVLEQSVNLGKPREEIEAALKKGLGLKGDIGENLTKSLVDSFEKVSTSAEEAALKLSFLSIQSKNEIDARERFIALGLSDISRNQSQVGTNASLFSVTRLLGRLGETGGIENVKTDGVLAARARLENSRTKIRGVLGSGFENISEENFAALLKLPNFKEDEDRQDAIKAAGFDLSVSDTGKLIDAIKEYNTASSDAASEQLEFNTALEKARQVIPVLTKAFDLLGQSIREQIDSINSATGLNRASRLQTGRAAGQAVDVLSDRRITDETRAAIARAGSLEEVFKNVSVDQQNIIKDAVANSIFSSNSVRRDEALSLINAQGTRNIVDSRGKRVGQADVVSSFLEASGDTGISNFESVDPEALPKAIRRQAEISEALSKIQSTTNDLLQKLNQNLAAILIGGVFQLPSFAPPGPPVPGMPTALPEPPSVPSTPPIPVPKPQQEVDEWGDPVKPKTKEKKKSEKEELSEVARALEKAAEEMSASRSKDQDFQKTLIEAIKDSFKDPKANAGSIPLATEVNGTVRVDITGIPQRVDAQVAKESLAGFARSLINSLEGQTDPATQRIVRSIEEALKKISETTKP